MWIKGKEIVKNDHKNCVVVEDIYAGGNNVPAGKYS